ncbi:hypothetical protein DV738_g892, partial [Chaetothyriales sp. CBS 135597]
MAELADNPLISTKQSDLDITVSLHPLVLLTASDQITRHRVRGDKGPIAGILLGQQRGREITAEHAFAAAFEKNEADRDVHKAPALDVVGWFTLCSAAGPHAEFVPLQLQLNSINDSAVILLAIHPEAFEFTQAVNQKLPITVYEAVSESETTDEAEMIAINYVAKGAGSAAAVTEQSRVKQAEADTNKKGKKRATPPAQDPSTADDRETNGEAGVVDSDFDDLDLPTTEEQDIISSIQTRLNSVKMLQSRIDLLHKFVASIPPSTRRHPTPTRSRLEDAARAQANDVALAQLLSAMNHDVQALSELGKKFSVVDAARAPKRKGGVGGGGGGGGGVGPGGAGGPGGGGAAGWAGLISPLDDAEMRKLRFGSHIL